MHHLWPPPLMIMETASSHAPHYRQVQNRHACGGERNLLTDRRELCSRWCGPTAAGNEILNLKPFSWGIIKTTSALAGVGPAAHVHSVESPAECVRAVERKPGVERLGTCGVYPASTTGRGVSVPTL